MAEFFPSLLNWRLKKVVRYYKLAADQGNSKAQFNLRQCYEHDFGVRHGFQEVFNLYLTAKKSGYDVSERIIKNCHDMLR